VKLFAPSFTPCGWLFLSRPDNQDGDGYLEKIEHWNLSRIIEKSEGKQQSCSPDFEIDRNEGFPLKLSTI
jgi:hypothetical protein